MKRYTITAIGLHWLMAAALFSMFALGLYMADLPLSPEKLKLYSWHKWAAVRVFFSDLQGRCMSGDAVSDDDVFFVLHGSVLSSTVLIPIHTLLSNKVKAKDYCKRSCRQKTDILANYRVY